MRPATRRRIVAVHHEAFSRVARLRLSCGHARTLLEASVGQAVFAMALRSLDSYALCERCARGAPADPRSKGTV